MNESALRRRAEEKARIVKPQEPEPLSPEESARLLHELRVHQIELEMQNEELRRAREELDASRARYFDLYDLAPVGYLTLGAHGTILEANLTAATQLGLPKSSLSKTPLTRYILPDDQDIYYLHRKGLFETGEPQVFEIRILRLDGTQFWARVEAHVAQDGESGTPVCRVALSDIAKRKRAEDALHESNQRYKSLNAELEVRVRERTAELERKNRELQEFAPRDDLAANDTIMPKPGFDAPAGTIPILFF
jgi:PAS domain S-box-containing protein